MQRFSKCQQLGFFYVFFRSSEKVVEITSYRSTHFARDSLNYEQKNLPTHKDFIRSQVTQEATKPEFRGFRPKMDRPEFLGSFFFNSQILISDVFSQKMLLFEVLILHEIRSIMNKKICCYTKILFDLKSLKKPQNLNLDVSNRYSAVLSFMHPFFSTLNY